MKKRLSHSRLWSVVRKTLIGKAIRRCYWFYKLNIQTTTSSVGEYEATFVTDSIAEYERVNSFVGEEDMIRAILNRLDENDTYWDIGANVGTHAVFPLLALSEGSVTAFEPVPAVSDRLRKNLEINADENNWTVEEVALFNKNGQGKIKIGNDDPGSGTHSISDNGGVPIQLRRADDYIQEHGPPDVVKIDVEGAEAAVVEGFGDLLGEVRTFLIEVHPDRPTENGSNEKRLRDILTESGFEVEEVFQRDPSGSTYHLLATRE